MSPNDARWRVGLTARWLNTAAIQRSSYLAICLFVARPAHAATITSVSGTPSHGNSITISGSAFGTKAQAAPVKYDDFQSGASMTANGWIVEGYHPPVFATNDLRPGTPYTRNVECRWERGIDFGRGGDASNFHLNGLTQTTYILDYWMKAKWTGTPAPQNIKPWRLHQVGAESTNLYMGWNVGGGSSIGDWILIGEDLNVGNGTQPNDLANYNTTIPFSMGINQWVHQTVLAKVGTPGGATGSIMVYTNGGDGGRTWWMGNFPMLKSGETNFPEAWFGNYVRSDDHVDVYFNWESVYFDSSWARVEIGNNPVYNNCTHREIQIPSAWSNTSVSARINRGSFAPNAAVYLFVVDANNVASPGFPITLGGTPPPSNACDLNNSGGQPNVTDVQLCANQAIGVASCTNGDINQDTRCNVIDVQRVVNAALGGTCVTQ